MHGFHTETKRVVVMLSDEYGTPVKMVAVDMPVLYIPFIWGEDADGNRGEKRYEIMVDKSEAFIPAKGLLGLTSQQVEEVLAIAEEKIYREAGA